MLSRLLVVFLIFIQYSFALSSEDPAFLEKRQTILSKAEVILQKNRWLFYLTESLKSTAAGAKTIFLFDGESEKPSPEIQEMIRIDQENYPEKYRSQSFKLRVDNQIQNILSGIDQKISAQPELIAQSNEISFLLSVSLVGLGGTNEKHWGGAYGFGISIGFNSESKKMSFKIFRDKEFFKSTVMKAVAVGGLVIKAGIKIAADQNKSKSTTGESFYPPFVPGYQASTKESFSFGFSSGLTWPPSPFADVLTYTNELQQDTFIRLDFSPFLNNSVAPQLTENQHLDFDTLPQFSKAMSCSSLF